MSLIFFSLPTLMRQIFVTIQLRRNTFVSGKFWHYSAVLNVEVKGKGVEMQQMPQHSLFLRQNPSACDFFPTAIHKSSTNTPLAPPLSSGNRSRFLSALCLNSFQNLHFLPVNNQFYWQLKCTLALTNDAENAKPLHLQLSSRKPVKIWQLSRTMRKFHLNKSHTSKQRKAAPDLDAAAAVFHCGYGVLVMVYEPRTMFENASASFDCFLWKRKAFGFEHYFKLWTQDNVITIKSQPVHPKGPAAFSVSLSASSIPSLPVCLFVMPLLLHIFSHY